GPSHLPLQEPAAPPDAAHEPLQVPSHLPSHSRLAPAFALHVPVHAIWRLPPLQTGGFALRSHSPVAEHFAWQLPCALSDASHRGGSNESLSVPPATPFTRP